MDTIVATTKDPPLVEQLALLGPPTRLWRSNPHPRSLACDDDYEGGAFRYQACPEIFFDRTDIGPMRVAMDTLVLINSAEFGEQIWSDEPFEPNVTDPEHGEELIALAEVMGTAWSLA